ncbi:MAG TPA: ROK family protein [Solirubrobacteraceae bacterium]|nr:ROK family protein [Solirubrobacteraceae bacterium]
MEAHAVAPVCEDLIDMSSGGAPRTARGGIDLGGTKIEAVVVDARNNVLGSARRPTPTAGTPADVAGRMAEAITEAAQVANLEPSALLGIGVGSPGVVHPETGAVTSARNLPGWEGTFELAAVLSDALGTRVAVGNDVQVATDAEYKLGAGKPYRSLLGVFWGTGVGGGLILNGKPWIGRGGAGEIGHVVVEVDGARCGCGRRGCMEAYAGRGSMEARARRRVEKGSKTELFTLMKEYKRTRLTSSIWWHALERKDKVATRIIDEAVVALGAGIGSAVNLLDVEAVIIGGGLGVRFGEPMATRIAAQMQPHLFNDGNPPDVRVAALGDLGGALGAALLARPMRVRPPTARPPLPNAS